MHTATPILLDRKAASKQPAAYRDPIGVRPPRRDLYRVVHKALRALLADSLVRVGRIDVDDAADRGPALEQLAQTLDFLVDHLRHEDAFLHPAIESRLSGGTARVVQDHADHLQAVVRLREDCVALSTAPATERTARAHRLYLDLSVLFAETCLHLHEEETAINGLLWKLYTDTELGAMHERLLASMSPSDVLFALRCALPACSPAERAELVTGMKAVMPPEALMSVLVLVRERLDGGGWVKLARAAGVDAGLGAMD